MAEHAGGVCNEAALAQDALRAPVTGPASFEVDGAASPAATPPKGTEISLRFQPDGRVVVRSWHAGRFDASYAPVPFDRALTTVLPQLFREMAEFIRATTGGLAAATMGVGDAC